ncbi:hypothetical protein [Acidianus sp. HS-5]|uniref:hypothetical protein n=1 Tax=Acidianus sp. HS-5 TaxID=2886040 RepID=UPI001F289F17|nr:hypothetical protein [Acidianus sp. HS-5]BDC17481.1 hypothetical protein HS5_03710 [Acidianus sp. HS-5]
MVRLIIITLLFLFLSLALIPQGYSYGYEFGYVETNGIQAIVSLYNLSVNSLYWVSIQQNVCLNFNGTSIFVQNVIQPYLHLRHGYEIAWQTSLYYDGSYHIHTFTYLEGTTFNITTAWSNTSCKLIIDFYISNGSVTENYTCVLVGKFIDVIYNGYSTGTVVVGYACGETAYLGKGFNVSIEEFYKYDGRWYVPPIAYSGYPNTGESAFCGCTYYYDGKAWVVYGHGGVKQLYNFSVVIVNNTVYTFPRGSLWLVNGKPFVNCTKCFGVINPFSYFNYSFFPKKEILLCFHNCTEVDGVKGRVFYLPFPEEVYLNEDGKCVSLFVNKNITANLSCTSSSSVNMTHSTKELGESESRNGIGFENVIIIFAVFLIIAVILRRKR